MRRSLLVLALLLLASTASAASLEEALTPFKGKKVALLRSDKADIRDATLDEVGSDYIRVSYSRYEGQRTSFYVPFSAIREFIEGVDPKEKRPEYRTFINIVLVYNGPIN